MKNHPEYAQLLIEAVQSLSVDQLRNAIKRLDLIAGAEVAHLRKESDRAWGKKNYVDSTFGPLGLTALHVAAKAYAEYSRQHGKVFNEMVRVLLKAGANPLMPIGLVLAVAGHGDQRILKIQDPGRTIIQECGGNAPPALRAFYRAFKGDEAKDTRRGEIQMHSTTKAREEKRLEHYRLKSRRIS